MPSPENLPQELAEVRAEREQRAAERQAGKLAMYEATQTPSGFVSPAAAREASMAANAIRIPVDFSLDSGPQAIPVNHG